MLVYKKVISDGRINNGKKNKTKKPEAETNSHSVETHSDMDKPDSSDEGKRKNGPTSTVSNSTSPGKILKLDTENKMDIVCAVSSSQDADSTSNERNGKHYESDNKENHYDAQPKSAKIDYKRLNGAAHRAMSCGERDFYEEVKSVTLIVDLRKHYMIDILQMEFECWEVSRTLRELVRQENVKHELSLLAIQQEKVCTSIYLHEERPTK